MFKGFLLASLVLFSCSLFAQTVYRPVKIMMENGEELSAEINPARPYSPKFKNPGIDPDRVQRFTLEDNRIFEKRMTKAGDTLFMEILVDGSIELLRNKRHFYVREDNSSEAVPLKKMNNGTAISDQKRVKVEKKPYVGILRYTLRDCPEIQSQVDEVKLNTSSLSALLEDYSICTKGEYRKYGSDMPGIGIDINPSVAWTHNTYEMEVNEFAFVSPDLEATNDLSYGISFNVYFNSLSKRFSLTTGYMYHSAEINGFSEHNQDFINYQNNVSIEYSEHQFTAGIRYEIPWRPVTPYVFVQRVINIAGDTESTITRVRYNTSQDLLIDEEIVENTIELKDTSGTQFGLGARLHMGKSFSPFVEYRTADFTDTFTASNESNRTQQMVLAGVSWSFGR